jgi:hypothetical protein
VAVFHQCRTIRPDPRNLPDVDRVVVSRSTFAGEPANAVWCPDSATAHRVAGDRVGAVIRSIVTAAEWDDASHAHPSTGVVR